MQLLLAEDAALTDVSSGITGARQVLRAPRWKTWMSAVSEASFKGGRSEGPTVHSSPKGSLMFVCSPEGPLSTFSSDA